MSFCEYTLRGKVKCYEAGSRHNHDALGQPSLVCFRLSQPVQNKLVLLTPRAIFTLPQL